MFLLVSQSQKSFSVGGYGLRGGKGRVQRGLPLTEDDDSTDYPLLPPLLLFPLLINVSCAPAEHLSSSAPPSLHPLSGIELKLRPLLTG